MGRARTISLLLLLVISAPLGLLGTSRAAADDLPLAVTVESASARVRARALRQALARALDVAIVSLLDAEAERTRGTLAIEVAADGRSAQLLFQERMGRRKLSRVAAPEGESGVAWIALAVVEFIRDDLRRSAWPTPSEVIDPFDEGPLWPTPGTSEVLDPWAEERRREQSRTPETGEALAQPRPH